MFMHSNQEENPQSLSKSLLQGTRAIKPSKLDNHEKKYFLFATFTQSTIKAIAPIDSGIIYHPLPVP